MSEMDFRAHLTAELSSESRTDSPQLTHVTPTLGTKGVVEATFASQGLVVVDLVAQLQRSPPPRSV